MFRVPFLEPCAGCGGFVEIETESEYLVLDVIRADIGDVVRCSQCECTGVISSAEGAQYCAWGEALCTVCEAEFEMMLSNLVYRIVLQIRER